MIRTKPFGIVHVTTFTHFSDILFFLIVRRPPRSTRTYHSFPTRRAADLVSTIALLGLGLYTASTSGNKEAPKAPQASNLDMGAGLRRSEERRVGKECVSTCRSRWSPYHSQKNNNTSHLRSSHINHIDNDLNTQEIHSRNSDSCTVLQCQ